jgi:hypothetical protein
MKRVQPSLLFNWAFRMGKQRPDAGGNRARRSFGSTTSISPFHAGYRPGVFGLLQVSELAHFSNNPRVWMSGWENLTDCLDMASSFIKYLPSVKQL